MKNVSMTVAFLSTMTTLARSMSRLNFTENEVDELVLKGLMRRFITFNDSELNFMKIGEKIQAIREVRTRLGLGLLEAKNLVEEKMAKEGWTVKTKY